MGYALLFSGQGTQHPGMFPWLEGAPQAQPVIAAMQDCLGADWRGLLAQGACAFSNELAQPLITGTAVAAWAALQAHLADAPEVVAGYSVGELAACSAAGVFSPGRVLRLARERALAMDRAVAGHDTGMLSIGDLSEADVLAACPALECAIRIDVDKNVYGGLREDLRQAEAALGQRAQFKRICVALASHTSWMQGAADAFRQTLASVPALAPACAIAMNATGCVSRRATEVVSSLAAQLASCVEWGACMAAVAERRPSCVLEIGGGSALARLWSARYPHVPARSLDDFRTVEGAAHWIGRFQ